MCLSYVSSCPGFLSPGTSRFSNTTDTTVGVQGDGWMAYLRAMIFVAEPCSATTRIQKASSADLTARKTRWGSSYSSAPSQRSMIVFGAFWTFFQESRVDMKDFDRVVASMPCPSNWSNCFRHFKIFRRRGHADLRSVAGRGGRIDEPLWLKDWIALCTSFNSFQSFTWPRSTLQLTTRFWSPDWIAVVITKLSPWSSSADQEPQSKKTKPFWSRSKRIQSFVPWTTPAHAAQFRMIGVTFVSHSVKIISGAVVSDVSTEDSDSKSCCVLWFFSEDHPFQLPSTWSQKFSNDGATALDRTDVFALTTFATFATWALRKKPSDVSKAGKVGKVASWEPLDQLEVGLQNWHLQLERLQWEWGGPSELREIMELNGRMALFTSAKHGWQSQRQALHLQSLVEWPTYQENQNPTRFQMKKIHTWTYTEPSMALHHGISAQHHRYCNPMCCLHGLHLLFSPLRWILQASHIPEIFWGIQRWAILWASKERTTHGRRAVDLCSAYQIFCVNHQVSVFNQRVHSSSKLANK